MQEIKMLEIINTIQNLLEKNCIYETKEYIQIEIKNLKGITQKECMKYKYSYDWYCKYCHNINCDLNARSGV